MPAPTPSPHGLPDVRCLGGLPAVRPDGSTGRTVPGRVLRGPAHALLGTGAGAALRSAGIATVVDLRSPGEGDRSAHDGVTVLQRPVEDPQDAEFQRDFGPDLGSPRYYREIVRRWPNLLAEAVAAVARAPRGGVLVHCAAGRDRTGQVSALLLALVGVPAEAVADQDEQARRDANTYLSTHPRPHEVALDDGDLDRELAAARTELIGFLRAVDLPEALLAAGLTEADVAALQDRLLTP
ncbi:MAG TPA: tyrosine-protein phosphatase [Cellulomonas sp.]